MLVIAAATPQDRLNSWSLPDLLYRVVASAAPIASTRTRRSLGQAALFCFFLCSCKVDPGAEEGVGNYRLASARP